MICWVRCAWDVYNAAVHRGATRGDMRCKAADKRHPRYPPPAREGQIVVLPARLRRGLGSSPKEHGSARNTGICGKPQIGKPANRAQWTTWRSRVDPAHPMERDPAEGFGGPAHGPAHDERTPSTGILDPGRRPSEDD